MVATITLITACIICYLLGCMAAAIIIAYINYDEAQHDSVSFIPYREAWYSWAFVMFVTMVLIETYRRK